MNKKSKDDRIFRAARSARIYHTIDTKSALQKTKEKIGLGEQQKPNIRLFPVIFKVAASIAIAVGIGWVIYQNQYAPKWTSYTAGMEIKEYKLSDGSIVTLNKNSTLQVNQNMADERLVRLQGEAFFDVKRDEGRAFIISAGETEVEVLGTSFNVHSDSNQVAVSVKTGKVRISEKVRKSNSATLTKGEAALYLKGKASIHKHAADANYLAWKTGVFTFKDIPVKNALKVLAKHNGISLEFEEGVAENCQITSLFDNQGWEDITTEFGLIHSLKFINQNDGTVLVKGGSCE